MQYAASVLQRQDLELQRQKHSSQHGRARARCRLYWRVWKFKILQTQARLCLLCRSGYLRRGDPLAVRWGYATRQSYLSILAEATKAGDIQDRVCCRRGCCRRGCCHILAVPSLTSTTVSIFSLQHEVFKHSHTDSQCQLGFVPTTTRHRCCMPD